MTPVHNVTTSEVSSADPGDGAPTGVPLLDFAREYAQIGPELLSAVEAVFRSQRFVLGPEVASFEEAAARHCGVTEAIGCASGTDALWLAMAAVGVQPGDRVLTTAFSFFATASAILRLGATPVLADIDPRTSNIDPKAASAALEKHPAIRAILAVHLYGQCADWTALSGVAGRCNCLLIEDAAQAFGAQWDGTSAGALGAAAAFSFYPTKNLSAAGEAGMVTTSSVAIARRVRSLRAHGMEVRYYHEEIGWNSRLDTLQAAVLLVKLRHVDEWNQRRRALAARYDELFTAAGNRRAGPLSASRVGAALGRSQGASRVPPVRYPRGAPGRAAGVAYPARHWLGNLLSSRAPSAEGAGLPWLSPGNLSGERARGPRSPCTPDIPAIARRRTGARSDCDSRLSQLRSAPPV